MELDESLSMLWSGELPEDEAEQLRARIARDPEVALRWQRLCAAMEALAELPDAMEPPPLEAGALAPETRRDLRASRPRSAGLRALAVVAIAAVALLALRAQMLTLSDERVLLDGALWAEGRMSLTAGDAIIDVDGRAWISVEPPAGVRRVGLPDPEDEMNRSNIAAALAGAVITVVVWEGTATVRAASGGEEPVVVSAGQTHRTAAQHSAGLPKAPPSDPDLRQQHIADLEQQLAEVERALAEARFEGALTRGQLAALQGVPSPWPADVPDPWRPENFRAALEERLRGVEGAEIAEVDCAEYPCIAAIHYTGPDKEDWERPLGSAVQGWLDEANAENLSVTRNTSRFRDDEREERYIIFGAYEGEKESDVGTRTEYRIDAVIDDLGQRMKEESP